MKAQETQQLEQYLSQLRSTGSIDSEGHFTVAGLRAVGKMAAFLLEDDSDWILKMVQAACHAKSSQLHIKQTHNSTHIQFDLPFLVDLNEFESNLISLSAKASQPGVNDLINGLRAVGMGQCRTWIASLAVNGEKALLSCTSGEISAERRLEASPVPDRTDILIGVAYPENQSGKLGGLIRFGEAVQNEHMALLLKARSSSIPLYLDGRRIDDLFEPKIATALQSRAFLGVDIVTNSKLDSILVPSALHSSKGEKLQSRFNPHSPFHLTPVPQDRLASSIHRWYYNYACHEQFGKGHIFHRAVSNPSRLLMVRRGVVVGKKNLGFSLPISVDVFMSADHLRTDLTGLKVDPDELQLSLAREELRESAAFLEGIQNQLLEHSARPLSKDLLMYGGIGVLSLFSPWFAVKAVTGTISGLMLARSAQNHREIVRDCCKEITKFCVRLRQDG